MLTSPPNPPMVATTPVETPSLPYNDPIYFLKSCLRQSAGEPCPNLCVMVNWRVRGGSCRKFGQHINSLECKLLDTESQKI